MDCMKSPGQHIPEDERGQINEDAQAHLDPSFYYDFMGDEFDPFFGQNMGGDQNNEDENISGDQNNEDENRGGDKNMSSDEYDSDFEVDNCIDDDDVNMRDFRLNIDKDVENTYHEHVVIDEEVLDNERLDSGSDSDVNEHRVRKYMLRYLRNANENNSNLDIGQVFGNKMEAKELIKQHAVETRRQLRIVKDDLERVRVVCWGDMPTFQVDEGVVHTQDKEHNVNISGRGHNVKKQKNVGGRGKKTNPKKHQCPWAILVSRKQNCET